MEPLIQESGLANIYGLNVRKAKRVRQRRKKFLKVPRFDGSTKRFDGGRRVGIGRLKAATDTKEKSLHDWVTNWRTIHSREDRRTNHLGKTNSYYERFCVRVRHSHKSFTND